MKKPAILLGVASLLTFMAPFATTHAPQAAALGNACKNVTIKVDNNITSNGSPIAVTVKKVKFWSIEEGDWLTEDFTNKTVPAGRQNYTVASGQKVENAEGDRITKIKVYFKAKPHTKWINFTVTDSSVANQTCVAGKTYTATMNGNL
ncbi:hypothetical protein IQ266_10505 [filamentous cyanobacterium LEGE 11480]|uniref:Uncharacterized protein n=1 Tax=Romeriopsis navalis LEGE 11480 TaxID=2777977 RepID=A0A928VPC0_9CYAN|nr:hypothetical protein [Romeriopsis navalis]MBE9030160.1 hypothetical protein [Romeriopsis navalis LEGE 11480]